jgi:hypothetical protein
VTSLTARRHKLDGTCLPCVCTVAAMPKKKKLEGLAKGMEEARRIEKELDKKDQAKDQSNSDKIAKTLKDKSKKN